jgi:hypothetical protein
VPLSLSARRPGAILAGIINAYSARLKVKEVELNYLYKLRDGYLENARKVTGEVYISIGIALTDLFKGYERFVAQSTDADDKVRTNAKSEFARCCETYLQKIDDLFSRGADAF